MSPDRFGRYEVLYEIADGAMGRVYKAWDPVMSRLVAVKAVKSEYLTRGTASEYLKRFRREAQAAGCLSHPAIVRIFDVGFDFIVMEFVEGRTLLELIQAQGPVEPEAALRILGPVADAVDYAHQAGVVHRDVKPANILVQTDGRPKLMDFGIAHIQTSVMTGTGEVLGSPCYMSPEQIAGADVTGSSDVYALGVVAYEMLAGQPPFQGGITHVIYRVLNDVAPSPRQWNPDLPEAYDEVFARALQKDPKQRYVTAADLVDALARHVAEHSLVALVESPAPKVTASPAAVEPRRSGWYANVETVMTFPRRLPRPRVKLHLPAASVMAASLVALAAGSSALLVRPTRARPAAVVVAAERPATSPEAERIAPAAVPEPKRRPAAVRPEPSPATARAKAARMATPTGFGQTARASLLPDAPAPLRASGPARPRLVPARLTVPAVVRGQLVEPGPDVTPPRRIDGQTVYPRLKRGERGNGTVAISMIVDENGLPMDLSVVESAGAVLDSAALDSVRSWRFLPAQKNGVPVKIRWMARQTYQLTR